MQEGAEQAERDALDVRPVLQGGNLPLPQVQQEQQPNAYSIIATLLQQQEARKSMPTDSISNRLGFNGSRRFLTHQREFSNPTQAALSQNLPADSYKLIEESHYLPDNFNMESREIMAAVLSTAGGGKTSMHPLIDGFDEKRRGFYESSLDNKLYNLVQLELRNRRLNSIYDR